MEIIPITKNKSENEPDNANSLLFTTKLINGSFAKIPNNNAIKRKIPPIILQNVFLFISASPLFSLSPYQCQFEHIDIFDKHRQNRTIPKNRISDFHIR